MYFGSFRHVPQGFGLIYLQHNYSYSPHDFSKNTINQHSNFTMAKSNFYTRTGDRGTTSLVGGQRIKKSDIRLECYGTVDELNSFIGLLRAEGLDQPTESQLAMIQNELFVIGSNLATDTSNRELKSFSQIPDEVITQLEKTIDSLDEETPSMTGFILPAGGRIASLCHVCRTITRRVERLLFRLDEEVEVDANVACYLNRLSDYFFALARYESHRIGEPEITWKKRCIPEK